MQNYFYFYTSFTGLALLVHLIVNWHQLVNFERARMSRRQVVVDTIRPTECAAYPTTTPFCFQPCG